MRCFIVVPAAGIGTRMQSLIPKQYLKIGSVGVLEATLIKLSYLKMPIVVALSAKDMLFSKINLPDGASITTVVGGKNRRDSVLNALTSLKNIAKKDDWILVHDAARPLVKLKDLDLLVETLKNDDVGGVLAAPIIDTIKQSDNKDNVVATLDRSYLWKALTPQMFRFGMLLEALSKYSLATDEAQAIEKLGFVPKLVASSASNIKITSPEDLAYAEWAWSNNI